jgi:hypothetical protein
MAEREAADNSTERARNTSRNTLTENTLDMARMGSSQHMMGSTEWSSWLRVGTAEWEWRLEQ